MQSMQQNDTGSLVIEAGTVLVVLLRTKKHETFRILPFAGSQFAGIGRWIAVAYIVQITVTMYNRVSYSTPVPETVL